MDVESISKPNDVADVADVADFNNVGVADAAAAGNNQEPQSEGVLDSSSFLTGLQIADAEAAMIQEQNELRQQLIETDAPCFDTTPDQAQDFPNLQYVGGVDISFLKSDARRAVVCLTVLSYPALKVEAAHFKEVTMTQPYIPGLLAFRECECLEQLLTDVHLKAQHDKTIKLPQVIFVDGNGKLHHRAFGLACHLGVKTNLPTIGIGKKLLLVDDIDKAQFYSGFGKAQQQARQTNTAGSTEVVMPVQGRSGAVWANAIAFDKSVLLAESPCSIR